MEYDPWHLYFERLCGVIGNSAYRIRDTFRYGRLLWQLHNTEFVPMLTMDNNRIYDAYELRRSLGYTDTTHPVCMYEMMVALAQRLETDIMHGTSVKDRTNEWFWRMIDSLGLSEMDDEKYDSVFVEHTLQRFMNRTYSPNGEGGLFTISNPNVDMRKEEIWYQAGLYLTNVLREEGYIEP